MRENERQDGNNWQVDGIRRAIEAADRGELIPHAQVKAWVESWSDQELPMPKLR
jgi:predicted transcriptional regulator